MSLITKEKFTYLFPKAKNSDGWVAAFCDLWPQNGITTKDRIAMFLAQCGHESHGWTRFEENLNYSSERLLEVFKKYFKTKADADKYARKPQMIASRVYANRMGNGPESSQDGWKYRGRGAIQLTGKSNYMAFSKDTFGDMSIVESPDRVATDIEMCLKSALWYWKIRNINSVCHDIREVTRRINGGYIGLSDRTVLFNTIFANL